MIIVNIKHIVIGDTSYFPIVAHTHSQVIPELLLNVNWYIRKSIQKKKNNKTLKYNNNERKIIKHKKQEVKTLTVIL